ncbi:hypothetical protein ZWY2020_000748 [Hordeum vulgare]|nr:hypothetical protein ZWY2020_000748 [Hordeum vulgare]
MTWKYVDLEKGGVAVEPEEPWPASDAYIPGPGCVFGVLFGCFSLVYVVVILVSCGPWPALGMAAVSAVLDYVVVLGAREGFRNEEAMVAQAARRKYGVAPPPACNCFHAAMAREGMAGEETGGWRTGRPCSAVSASTTEAHQQPKTTAGQADRTGSRTRKLNPYFNGCTDWEK